MAKALDDLYEFGVDRLMTGVALEAVRQYGLDTRFLHFDTTTLSFYGAYEREGLDAVGDGIAPPPKITYGHRKAKRPDLKQVLFGCLSTSDGGIPRMGKVMDGNLADSVAAAEFFGRVRELVADPREVCLVADSKGWCDRTLGVVDQAGMRLLSRLPRTEGIHRALMEIDWVPTLVRAYGQDQVSPGRTLRTDGIRLRTNDHDRDPRCPGHRHQREAQYPDPSGAVRISSTALVATKVATLNRTRTREDRRVADQIRDWQAIAYACEVDAQRAADRHVGQYEAITHDLTATVERHDGPAKRGRGRPPKRPEPELNAAVHWRVR